MDAPAARRLQGADLRSEVLAFGPGHPGVADQDRCCCVMRLLFRFDWHPVFARRNALFCRGLRGRQLHSSRLAPAVLLSRF